MVFAGIGVDALCRGTGSARFPALDRRLASITRCRCPSVGNRKTRMYIEKLRIYVNIVDMGQIEDAPLGYLLYRVGAVLRPEVSAVLGPLGLTLPEFVCLRILSMSPGLSSAE